MQLAKQLLINFLDFARCQCFQLFPVFPNKKVLAFQSIKESSLERQRSLGISLAVPLEFHQFDKLPLRHFYETDSLHLISDFCGILWQPF